MVEDSVEFESSLEVKAGMEFSNGYLSQYFVTDSDRMICEYSDAYVLVTDYSIADAMQLVPILEKVIKDNNKPILIIASDIVGPALKSLALTKLKSHAKIIAVMAPEYGDRRKEALEDIALLTGAVFISSDLNKKLEDVELKDLGKLSSLLVTQTTCTFTPKYPDSEEVKDRVNAIAIQIKEETNDFKKGKLEERMAKLSSSVAVINIGGGSDSEIKDKHERTIDAVYATKGALAEGIIPGGGVALMAIAAEIKTTKSDAIENLVIATLFKPYDQLLENSGLNISDFKPTENEGVDVINKKQVNMIEVGIVDPVKVVKSAIRFSFSVAATILTTDYLISDDLEVNRNIQKVKPV